MVIVENSMSSLHRPSLDYICLCFVVERKSFSAASPTVTQNNGVGHIVPSRQFLMDIEL